MLPFPPPMPTRSDLERERDVLRRLLSVMDGAFVIWDQDLAVVSVSPTARTLLASELPGSGLESAAAAALRELEPPEQRGVGAEPRELRRELRAGAGNVLSVEFVCIRTDDARRWLVAKLRRPGIERKLATLTRAEGEVLRRLIQGGSNREIASALFVSTETVRTHVSRILGKLDVSSRAKAASLARGALSSEP